MKPSPHTDSSQQTAATNRTTLQQRIASKQARKQQQQQTQTQQPCLQDVEPLLQGQQQPLNIDLTQNEQSLQQQQQQSSIDLTQNKQQLNNEQTQNKQQPLSVEVDVVACGGACWIEVKAQEAYGVDSPHWDRKPGSSGHGRVSACVFVSVQMFDVLCLSPCAISEWNKEASLASCQKRQSHICTLAQTKAPAHASCTL